MSASSVAQQWHADVGADLGVAPATDVDHRECQGFVERGVGVGNPDDAAPVAQRLVERATQKDRDVLRGVVGVDLEVAVGLHRQVKQSVASEGVEQVVQEPDAGLNVRPSGAVDIDGYFNACLAGLPFEMSAPRRDENYLVHAYSPISASAASRRSFSSGRPTEIRRQFSKRSPE